ncbi:MAG: hypothetical protein A2252_07980 [Elusimicrobia bacterium RIFOXYA2_FULL_39_19]|nr:MAG: hypothetical protein A2252_07980 [Elusimicrobia bacterium RIFOXYA2_FULL_39_19]
MKNDKKVNKKTYVVNEKHNKVLLITLILLTFISFYKFPDKIILDDGLIFGTMLDGHIPSFKLIDWYPRHLIYNNIAKLFYFTLNSVNNSYENGYVVLQLMNNIYGFFGAIIFCMFLYFKSSKLYKSILFTMILIYSYGYWSRATEGQVYMSSIFWVLAAFCFVQHYIEKKSLNKVLIGSVLLTLMAIYHHITNVLLVVPIFISYLLIEDRIKGIKYSLFYLGSIFAGIVIPYALIFNLYSINSFIVFFKGHGETHLAYTDIGSKFTISYMMIVLKNLVFPVIFVTRNKLMSVLSFGVVLVLIYGWWLFVIKKGYSFYKQFPSYVALILIYSGFFYFWYPDTPWFWIIPFFPVVLIAFYGFMLDDISTEKKKMKWAIIVLSIILLLFNNLIYGVYYNSKEENNIGLQMAKYIADNIPKESAVIVAGQGSRFNGDRFYLMLIYSQSRISFYDGLLGYSKNDFFNILNSMVLEYIREKKYVYTTNTIKEDQVYKHFNKLFKVNQEDFEKYFYSNYIFIPIAAENRLDLKIYQVFQKSDDRTLNVLLRDYAKSYIKQGFYKNAYSLYNNIPEQFMNSEDKKIMKVFENTGEMP